MLHCDVVFGFVISATVVTTLWRYRNSVIVIAVIIVWFNIDLWVRQIGLPLYGYSSHQPQHSVGFFMFIPLGQIRHFLQNDIQNSAGEVMRTIQLIS